MTATPAGVAAWMLAELDRRKELYQQEAADHISQHFGREFTYENENGNLAIAKTVLAAFRKLTGDAVIWVRSDRYWRRRERGDEAGRQQ